MALVGPNGRPIVSVAEDGATNKTITIQEHRIQGRLTWGVEFKPSIEAFEFEEVLQTLADVITGLCRNARTEKAKARANARATATMEQMRKTEENTK